MTNNYDLALKLKAAAEKATPGKWYVDNDFDVCSESYGFVGEVHGDNLVLNAEFIATANPANILALLAERDADKVENAQLRQRVAELEAKNALVAGGISAASKLYDRIHELEARTVSVNLPPLDDDLAAILGRPNFTCSHLAELLRKSGEDIPRKSEREQAAVIYWFLGLYLEHGDKWECVAKADIQSRVAGIKLEQGE